METLGGSRFSPRPMESQPISLEEQFERFTRESAPEAPAVLKAVADPGWSPPPLVVSEPPPPVVSEPPPPVVSEPPPLAASDLAPLVVSEPYAAPEPEPAPEPDPVAHSAPPVEDGTISRAVPQATVDDLLGPIIEQMQRTVEMQMTTMNALADVRRQLADRRQRDEETDRQKALFEVVQTKLAELAQALETA